MVVVVVACVVASAGICGGVLAGAAVAGEAAADAGGAVAADVAFDAGVGAAAEAGSTAAEAGGEAATGAGSEAGESTAETSDDAASETRPESCDAESFSPDTKVLLASGVAAPISKVAVGSDVLAVDTKTGHQESRKVEHVWINHDIDLMDVTVSAGGKRSVIHSTQHHPFWDVSKRAWVQSQDLSVGDQLLSSTGRKVSVDSKIVVAGSTDMWDFTVAQDHDFFVQTSATALLVHNCPVRNPNPFKMNKVIKGSKASTRGISRIDRAHDDLGQTHAHFDGQRPALNVDGSIHDAAPDGSGPSVTNAQAEYLKSWGWDIP